MSTNQPAERVVLVVDDAEGTRFVFSSWLRREGYVVHEAASGDEAIQLLARVRFDIALLDVHLPDMSGFDLGDHIKSGRATASIPVLHVSATATTPEDRSAGLNRGADGYLVEPVERDELLSTVAALIRYHDARRKAELLAARLEQLHQTALLVNAAQSIDELIGFAAAGATAIFGEPSVILLARDGRGWLASMVPGDLDPTIEPCPVSTVLEIAASADGEALDLAPINRVVGDRTDAHAARITTPRGELVGSFILLGAALSAEDELMRDHYSQALAVAVENQRILSVEHQIAVTLQHAMLPRSIPSGPELEIAVRYLPGSEGVEVGGDFYEVVKLDEHRTLIAIGDVVGHSLIAATVMAEVRYSLRAFASLGLAASEIVARLGAMLLDSHPDQSATLCIVVVDRHGWLEVTNAGHIPPLIREGEAVRYVDEHGPMLGMAAGRTVPTVEVPLGEGGLVALVTDGLIERRRESILVGLDRLSAAMQRYEGDVEGLCDALLDDVVGDETKVDDIAIVTARLGRVVTR